ncbi:MAG: class I SAM-dependent methyltransferase [Pseudomonadota bacterium]
MNRRTHCPLCAGTRLRDHLVDWQQNRYQRCADCGMVIQNPHCPDIDYDDGYWGVVTDPDGMRRDLLKERRRRLKNWYGAVPEVIDQLPDARILDIGCGPGHLLSAVSNRHEKTALEVSSRCVEHIRRQYPEIRVKNATLETCAFAPDSFDVVLFYHVIEHLTDPLAALQAIHRLLKDGGLLIVGTPNISGFCARRFRGNFRLLGRPHLTLFDETTLTRILHRTGFVVTAKEFPFFRTDYFTVKNLLRLWNPRRLSPPFYKNVITFYARKKALPEGRRG